MSEASTLAADVRPFPLLRAAPPWRAVLGAVALLGLVLISAEIVVGAAAQSTVLVPSSRAGYPDWLQGPLGDVVDGGLTTQDFSLLLLAMCACYFVAVACARSVGARLAIAVVVVLHVLFLLAPPLISADVFAYLDFGRLGALHELNPYSHAIDAVTSDAVHKWVLWHRVSTPYGPLFTLMSYGLAPLSVAAGLWVLKATTALASLGCVALVWLCARRRGMNPVPAALFVGLNPVLLVYGVAGAHNDLLMMLLALAGIYYVLSDRVRLGAFALVGAAGIKASAGLLLPFMVVGVQRRVRTLVTVLVALVALAGIAFAFFGRDATRIVSTLGNQQQLVALRSVPRELASFFGFHHHYLPNSVRAIAALVLVVTVAALLYRTWRGRDWIAGAGWATLALLLTTAWLLPWYVVWLLPLAALADSRWLRPAALAFTVYIVLTRTLPILNP